ncbi:MAG: hypothetical protein RJB38_1760 [Pseudomonadota bacterium]|jgi:H+/Cl- antiporter ClcA
MIASIIHGFLGAALISSTLAVTALAEHSSWAMPLGALALVVLIALTAALQRHSARFRSTTTSGPDLVRYDGLSDLLIHLHTPATPDRPLRWMLRGMMNWGLSALGLGFGAEGVAAETSQALSMTVRTSTTRWSDLRRRTDAARALAVALSAGFGAPFAAVLLPAELSIGGRVLSSVVASVSAYVGIQYFSVFFAELGIPILGFQERLSQLWGFRFSDWGEWVASTLVVLASSMVAIAALQAIRGSRELFEKIGQRRAWVMTAICGLLLLSVMLLAPSSLGSSSAFFEWVLRNELSVAGLFSLAAALFLALAANYSGIGSLGVWWPSLLLGATASMLIMKVLLATGWIHSGVTANAVLLGAVAWVVIWFRTPVTMAVLAYEVSGRGSLLLPAFLACSLAKLLSLRFGGKGWIESNLEAKEFPIRGGRSVEVMRSLTAEEAMVRDFQHVREHDSIQHCRETIRQCRYPFLAVVNDRGAFTGLLTVDVIEQGLESQLSLEMPPEEGVDSRLGQLLEARDLLFHQQQGHGIVRTARAHTRLSELGALFETQICVPVVCDEGRPVGLLFSSDVRHAYDRELARISIMVQARVR